LGLFKPFWWRTTEYGKVVDKGIASTEKLLLEQGQNLLSYFGASAFIAHHSDSHCGSWRGEQ